MLSQPKHFCSNPGCQQWTWHSRKWPWVDRKNVSDDTIKVSTHTHIMYLYILIFKHNYTIYFSVYIYIYTYTRIHTSHNSTLYLPVWIYIYIYIFTHQHISESEHLNRKLKLTEIFWIRKHSAPASRYDIWRYTVMLDTLDVSWLAGRWACSWTFPQAQPLRS